MSRASFLLAGIAALGLAGCASFSPDAGMGVAQGIASAELGASVARLTSDTEAAGAREQVRLLLRAPLTADQAVQVALLSNRGLQAAFFDLGVSEAQFVQASLPPAPRFSYARLTGPGELELSYQAVVSLLELATLPARQEIAGRNWRAAQFRAAEQVLTLAAEARRQYYRSLAAGNSVAFLERALATADAASTLAKQLGETGALNKLEQAREHAFYGEIGAQLAKARIQQRVEREALVRRLGLWGPDLDFRLPGSLPALPRRLQAGGALEASALQKRVDLKVARLELEALAAQYHLGDATRFVSAFEFGLESNPERTTTAEAGTDTVKRRGFSAEFTIPIYDFGESTVREARERYFASASRLAEKAVNARSEVREAYLRYRGNYDLAQHYRSTVLPLNKTVQDQALLQYSGMLVDVSQLILDARTRILSNLQAIEAERDFWIASTDLKAAIIGGGFGRQDGETGGGESPVATATAAAGGD